MRCYFPYLVAIVPLAACSLANTADDPTEPSTTTAASTSSSGGNGVGGSATSTGGSTTSTGGQNAVCGNGEIEDSETCDDSGESADCDVDCSAAECGDGTVNLAANEKCDDGNMDQNDACDFACKITPFVVDPAALLSGNFPSVGPSVGVTPLNGESHFVVIHGHEDVSSNSELRLSVFGSSGTPVSTNVPISSSASVAAGRSAFNAVGRGLVVWTSNNQELRYRLIEPGGVPAGNGDVLIPGISVIGIPVAGAAANGELCMMWTEAQGVLDIEKVRCFDSGGTLQGTITQVGNAKTGFNVIYGSHSIFGVGNGLVAIFAEPNGSIQGRPLTATGTISGPSFQTSMLTSPNQITGNGFGTAGLFTIASVADASFGQPFTETRSFFRRFAGTTASSSEIPLGDEHRAQVGPHIVGLVGDGPLMAAWTEGDDVNLNDGCSAKMQKFGANNLPIGLVVEPRPAVVDECALFPRGAVAPNGDVMYAWTYAVNGGTGQIEALIVPRALE